MAVARQYNQQTLLTLDLIGTLEAQPQSIGVKGNRRHAFLNA